MFFNHPHYIYIIPLKSTPPNSFLLFLIPKVIRCFYLPPLGPRPGSFRSAAPVLARCARRVRPPAARRMARAPRCETDQRSPVATFVEAKNVGKKTQRNKEHTTVGIYLYKSC